MGTGASCTEPDGIDWFSSIGNPDENSFINRYGLDCTGIFDVMIRAETKLQNHPQDVPASTPDTSVFSYDYCSHFSSLKD